MARRYSFKDFLPFSRYICNTAGQRQCISIGWVAAPSAAPMMDTPRGASADDLGEMVRGHLRGQRHHADRGHRPTRGAGGHANRRCMRQGRQHRASLCDRASASTTGGSAWWMHTSRASGAAIQSASRAHSRLRRAWPRGAWLCCGGCAQRRAPTRQAEQTDATPRRKPIWAMPMWPE